VPPRAPLDGLISLAAAGSAIGRQPSLGSDSWDRAQLGRWPFLMPVLWAASI
jgi:hypothetical protein